MSVPEAAVHVGFLSSAGMGHLNPCLRLAAVFLTFLFLLIPIRLHNRTLLRSSSVPPAFLLQGGNSFQRMIMEDSCKLTKLDGVFINSFEELEGEALAALNEGKVVRGLPPVYGIGPLMACEFESVDQGQRGCMSWILEWLDEQAEGSVVYVSLGSRTETRKEQIKDMALGLTECGYSFLWVVKLKKVDIEEEEGLEEVLGSELMSKVREKGVVVKEFVDQIKILGHPAVGGCEVIIKRLIEEWKKNAQVT
ncbi:hypothetical protein PHAVU_004G138100 [Phaseolus vulgaris]